MPLLVEHALVGDVVDGEDRRNRRSVPAQVGRREAPRPVVDVQHVGRPAKPATAFGQLRGGQREAGEAQVVVGPVAAVRTAIGRSAALVQ